MMKIKLECKMIKKSIAPWLITIYETKVTSIYIKHVVYKLYKRAIVDPLSRF